MEMLVTKFSNGKHRNEGELFAEPISAENVKLMGEMIALQALRTHKKFDMKVADKLYIGLIKDLHCHIFLWTIFIKYCYTTKFNFSFQKGFDGYCYYFLADCFICE